MKFYTTTVSHDGLQNRLDKFLKDHPNAVIKTDSITCVALNEYRVVYSFFYRP